MIAILNYNAGNSTSVYHAVRRLGYDCSVTDDMTVLQQADKVIFPGVGEAGTAMSFLKAKGLDRVLLGLQQPVLGICLGMQLLCQFTEEGATPGLGVFNTEVRRFSAAAPVPHMGWNTCMQVQGPLFKGLSPTADYYFVHSYYARLCGDTAAESEYILPFSAALQKDNFFGTQFHPEKSGEAGSRLLQNFLKL